MAKAGEAEICRSVGLEAQRATHQLTKIHNEALKPIALTSSQFGILAYLYGARIDGRIRLSTRDVAEFTGLPLSSLSDHLKPLTTRGWIVRVTDTADRRKRSVSITAKGCTRLRRAVAFWRRAQGHAQDVLGAETAQALSGILDLTSTKLKKK